MSRILIVDDEKSVRETLREMLEYENYEVIDAENATKALDLLSSQSFDVILCDIKMPGMDGMELLEKILENYDIPVIMISGHGTIETAVDAIKKGAFDFIIKPFDLNRLLISIRNALDRSNLMEETKRLKNKLSKKYALIGDSPAMKKLKENIERIAPTDARVLIMGENGTGKENIAHWLHELSPRAKGPFVEVNCAAIPSELIESELFGHEKGAFTSAIKSKKGSFELANNGTLFLDEIGDMSLAAQAKVLRTLEENKITRVGGEKDIPVDVRVIAATNKNLVEEIKNKRFREDLFHRLAVIILEVPPLRERKEDIPLLIDHFVNELSESIKKPTIKFDENAIEYLINLPWRGNVRELRNVVERLMILCNEKVSLEDVKNFANPYY
ncbi:MAG: sigma-54 dependent transcriptional regulator [Bacteroidales bacterium]|jgi:two-component system nitrogen regulation response regulator NtrX|nr:sigma-54 dependent transcriptional regulator [Bacteroidales bacterium]MDI9576441.1 sigma-54 dependent transcriptional regulator [Bacteroidota bacterium]MDY0400386.1 sigma-54 dependent transcriptional regulator [Bacteroidales bacterium]HHW58893.1 sigma-54-dependent Fis family transcriptional regulator [Bacteroidales bacterium]HOB76877.1 sigma-54 dependent transcriptional regulator [Bacteroidales bacterium]